MSTNSLSTPLPTFNDIDGNPLDAGKIYVGTAGLDPEANPINTYFDAALTDLATQPIITKNGYPMNGSTPVRLYVSANDYSITIRNRNNSLIRTILNNTEIISGSNITIDDAGGYYTSGNVEGALQENGLRLEQLGSAIVLEGVWDASAGSFPTSTRSGQSWIVSVGGTVDSVIFDVSDRIVAITDNASTSTYTGNWFKLDYTDLVTSVDGKTGAVDLSGDYEPKDVTILKDADIGVTVQAYDADTTKNDVSNSFTGNQTLATGNLVIGTSGKGIDFSATADATGMQSELFDDYEKGNWTPILTTDGTNFDSVSYAFQHGGKYIKVGKMVYVHGRLNISSVTKGSASGNVLIGGLPYANMTGGISALSDAIGALGATSGWSTNAPMYVQASYGSSSIYLMKVDSAGATSTITVANVSTGSNVVSLSLAYEVD